MREPGSPPSLDPRRVRALVFDLDGTLVDSYGAITASLNHARAGFGLAPLTLDEVRHRVGWGLDSLIASLVGPEHVAPGVRLFRERYAELYAAETSALPEARETLEALHRRGFGLAVASNKPARFSRPILERLGMAGCLDCVMGPDLAGSAKPEPEMIRLCLAALGATPEEAVYVGDMVLDVETARRAALPVVLVEGGSSERGELERTGELLVGSLGRLVELFLAPASRPAPH